MLIAFFIFVAFIVFGAGVILLSNKALYAIYALLLVMLSVAGIFLLSQAEFVAVTQVMIYVGGVITFLLFNLLVNKDNQPLQPLLLPTWAIFLLLIGVVVILCYHFPPFSFPATTHATISLQTLGQTLMTTYVLPFELIGLLLLVVSCAIGYLFKKDNLKP